MANLIKSIDTRKRVSKILEAGVISAIIAYCMMAIVQKKMNVERSIYEMLQIVSISLTDTTNLRDLFAKPNCNIVNELDDSTEPNLFNC